MVGEPSDLMNNRIFFAVSATPSREAILDETHSKPLTDTGIHQATSLRNRIHKRCPDPHTICSPVNHVKETARRISDKSKYFPITALHWGNGWRPREASLAIFNYWRLHTQNLVVCMPFVFTEQIVRCMFPKAGSAKEISDARLNPSDLFEVTFNDCNTSFLIVTRL